jgi:hypothetical protein
MEETDLMLVMEGKEVVELVVVVVVVVVVEVDDRGAINRDGEDRASDRGNPHGSCLDRSVPPASLFPRRPRSSLPPSLPPDSLFAAIPAHNESQ